MDAEAMVRLLGRLKKAGVLNRIVDANGKILPSDESYAWVEREHPHEPPTEKFRLMQEWTAIELAKKYHVEMN